MAPPPCIVEIVQPAARDRPSPALAGCDERSARSGAEMKEPGSAGPSNQLRSGCVARRFPEALHGCEAPGGLCFRVDDGHRLPKESRSMRRASTGARSSPATEGQSSLPSPNRHKEGSSRSPRDSCGEPGASRTRRRATGFAQDNAAASSAVGHRSAGIAAALVDHPGCEAGRIACSWLIHRSQGVLPR